MCSSIRAYLNHTYFNCNVEIENLKFKQCAPRYQFNCAERTGNVLFTPLYSVVKKWGDTDSCIVRTGLAIASVFAAVIALAALAFKKIGECCNPKAEIRHQLVLKICQISNKNDEVIGMKYSLAVEGFAGMGIAISNASSLIEGIHIDLLFQEKILDKVAQNASLKDEWVKNLASIKEKLKTGQDITAERNKLSEITRSDPETNQKVIQFVDKCYGKCKSSRELQQLCKEYNALMDRLR